MFNIARILQILTIAVVAVGIALPLAPPVIRVFFPPVHSFEIVTAERLSDNRLRLTALLDKGWCVFQALSFAYHGPGRHVRRVGYEALDQPATVSTNRPNGLQKVGPWVIDAASDQKAERLTISVHHRCGLIDVMTRLATLELSEISSAAN